VGAPDVREDAARDSRPLGDLTLGAFISELGAAQPSPGSGAAAAVALSLAAACVAKAAAISLTHDPDDAELREARDEVSRLARRALVGAQKDAQAFERVLKEDTAQASRELLETDADLLAQCRSLEAWVDRIEPRVRPNVSGDLSAARELLRAAAEIHRLNLQALPQAPAGARQSR
jgi:formiminotetrahydrofolate cyclodeaminase